MLVSLVYIHLEHIPNLQEQIENNIVFHELQTTNLKNSVYTFTLYNYKLEFYEANSFR